MTLALGTRIGPYEIVALLGAGGMGEVYKAHHTKLNRDVALKILPESFASDADRVARFKREAQVLASLNHPNIAHVYGLEQADGVQALVMELVEGSRLADRIAQGGEEWPRASLHPGLLSLNLGPSMRFKPSNGRKGDAGTWKCVLEMTPSVVFDGAYRSFSALAIRGSWVLQ